MAMGELGHVERPKLHWKRRWGSWKADGVRLVAVVWADMALEMSSEVHSSLIKKALRQRLSEQLGGEAVVDVYEDLGRYFVALLSGAEDCVEVRKQWKGLEVMPNVRATWRDTIDTGSSQLQGRLKACWNPENLLVDAMSLEIPVTWGVEPKSLGQASLCAPESHWFQFAELFGEVQEAYLVATSKEFCRLVVHYGSTKGCLNAYEKLTGRCLQHPSSKKLRLGSARVLVESCEGCIRWFHVVSHASCNAFTSDLRPFLLPLGPFSPPIKGFRT